jgi:hypothetical protein
LTSTHQALSQPRNYLKSPQSIYRWKTVYTERQKDIRLDEIISDGNTREQAKKIQQLELQVEAYKIKLAEQMLINDLLKKIQDPHDSASENELNGLIDTTSKLARKRKPAKP